MPDDEKPQDPPRSFRTVCPECHGDGHRTVPTATVSGMTALSTKPCRTCKKSRSSHPGWLPGIVPPV
ncbi:hypothetical protein [Amycolatopsis antarctica]|nr:hypothetical protein [Amycolatopsis antarctica]